MRESPVFVLLHFLVSEKNVLDVLHTGVRRTGGAAKFRPRRAASA